MPRAELVGLLEAVVQRAGQLACEPPGEVAHRQERGRGHDLGEIGRQPADRRCDRHVVIVEDHDQAIAGAFRIVHRLIGHTGRHRAVADHRDRLAGFARQPPRGGEAQRRRDRGRAVRRPERIIFALGAAGKARQAAGGAQRADTVAPSGQDFCADRPGGRRPRSAGRAAYRTHNGARWSARPRPAPRRDGHRWWRPAAIVSARNSSANWRSCSGFSFRRSAGTVTVSSSGVDEPSDIQMTLETRLAGLGAWLPQGKRAQSRSGSS